MSVSWGTQYPKLKSNLRLASNRLKLLQKKKTEQAHKAQVEVAEFLNTDKDDRARIRVESIIREDFVVEAYEILEMYCELLLARFGLIQQMKELDDGIAEAVASIFWASPRIMHEVAEFKVISEQLQQKYGKQYAEAARMNQLPEPSRVLPKLIQKLAVTAPSKLLVEKYLIEIAKCANIDFVPDAKVMRDDDSEVDLAERNLINFMNEEQIGWNVAGGNRPADGGNGGGGQNPGYPNPNAGGGGFGIGGGPPAGGGGIFGPGVAKAHSLPPPNEFPAGGGGAYQAPPQYTPPTYGDGGYQAPPLEPKRHGSFGFPTDETTESTIPDQWSDQHSTVSAPTSAEVHGKGPAYDGGQQNPNKNEAKEVTQPPPQKPARYPAIDYEGTTTTFPAFPEPPSHSPAICGSCGGTGTTPASSSSPQQQQQPKPAGGNDLEFDALAKRFEELKKKI